MVKLLNRIRLEDSAHIAFSLSQQDRTVWIDLLADHPEIGNLYRDYIGKMHHSTHVSEWHVAPSAISGQTVEEDVLTLRHIGTRYLENYFKEMREHD